MSWVLGSLKVIRLCALSINFLWFLAFQDLSCMFTQLVFIWPVACLGFFFHSLEIPLGISLFETLWTLFSNEMCRIVGVSLCLFLHFSPHEARVAKKGASGSFWRLLPFYCYHLIPFSHHPLSPKLNSGWEKKQSWRLHSKPRDLLFCFGCGL